MTVSLSSFLVVGLTSYFLSLADVGVLGYVLSITVLAAGLHYASYFQVATLYAQKTRNKRKMFFSLFMIHLLLTLCIAATVFFIYVLFDFGDYAHSVDLLVLLLFVVFQQVLDFSRRSMYLFSMTLHVLMVSLVVHFIRVLSLYFYAPENLNDVVLVLMLTSMVGAISFFLIPIERCSLRKTYKRMRFFINESGYLILNLPVTFGLNRGPLFLLGQLVSIESAGFYMLVRNITNAANVVLEMVVNYFSPRIAGVFVNNESDYKKYILMVLKNALYLWGVGFLFLYMFGLELSEIVSGGKLTGVRSELLLMWVFNALLFLVSIQQIDLRNKKRTRIIPIANFSALCVLVLSSALFKVDVAGMIVSMIVSMTVVAFFQASYMTGFVGSHKKS